MAERVDIGPVLKRSRNPGIVAATLAASLAFAAGPGAARATAPACYGGVCAKPGDALYDLVTCYQDQAYERRRADLAERGRNYWRNRARNAR